jgi:molybdate transport system ATP-binding protein
MLEIQLEKHLQGADGRMDLAIQMRIQPRAFVTLFGNSGAGKTSVLRMLAGLTAPDAGRIVVDGEIWFDHADKINLSPQQRSIGLVFQDFALFPHLSVLDNVRYGLTKMGSAEQAWVAHLLDLTQLSNLQQRRPDQLSGGQKQRVALARALARKPKILLLDEPLSALDNTMRGQLQAALLHLHAECRLTTILVSHDIGEVFKLSQTVFCLHQGQIERVGSPAEVFLQNNLPGQLTLQAQILAIRQEQVIYILSLLIGQDVIEIIASKKDVEHLQVGAYIAISPKTFNPLIFSTTQN